MDQILNYEMPETLVCGLLNYKLQFFVPVGIIYYLLYHYGFSRWNYFLLSFEKYNNK